MNNEQATPMKKAAKTAFFFAVIAFAASYPATREHANDPNYRLLLQASLTIIISTLAFLLSWIKNKIKQKKTEKTNSD